MDIVDQHFERLKADYSDAQLSRNSDGSAIVTVAHVDLPNGWNKQQTAIKFVVPVGYPVARPDCFWADSDLRLKHGGMPGNTGFNNVYDLSQHLWFSYHPSIWNPNGDDFVTYMNVIRRRLADAR